MNRFVAITTALAAVVAGHAADPVDFKKQVRPILEVYCLKCHRESGENHKHGLTEWCWVCKAENEWPHCHHP